MTSLHLSNNFLVSLQVTLRSDKVSVLTRTYPHIAMRKIVAITRLTASFTYGLLSDLVICKYRKEYGHT